MTRFIASTIALAFVASAAGATGNPGSEQVLIDGLHAVAAAVATAAGQPIDPDEGDDHASDRAIFIVCNHDNPSAERSAICPTPNSPP
jgi:hypothetical protein